MMMNINSFANRYSREDHSHPSTWAINCVKRPWEDMTEPDIDINPYLSIYLSTSFHIFPYLSILIHISIHIKTVT